MRTTLSIHSEYFTGGGVTRMRRLALFFAGSGLEKSLHSGGFRSLGVNGAATSCSRKRWIAVQICASAYGS